MNNILYAGFWRRFFANLIDWGILSAVSWIFEKVFGLFFNPNGLELQIVMLVLYAVFSLFYYTFGHFRYGTTLGKIPFKVRVFSYPDLNPLTLKKSLWRTCGYALSWLPLGCGFLMVLFNRQKVALHDLVAGTVSVVQSRFSPTKYVTPALGGTEAV